MHLNFHERHKFVQNPMIHDIPAWYVNVPKSILCVSIQTQKSFLLCVNTDISADLICGLEMCRIMFFCCIACTKRGFRLRTWLMFLPRKQHEATFSDGIIICVCWNWNSGVRTELNSMTWAKTQNILTLPQPPLALSLAHTHMKWEVGYSGCE